MIGVASVIAVMAIGIMGRRAIMGDLGALGGALYWIDREEGGSEDGRRDQHLRIEHLEAIAALVADTSWVSPILRGDARAALPRPAGAGGAVRRRCTVLRVVALAGAGGALSRTEEVSQRRKVIVLGDRVAHALFDDAQRAVGSVVTAGGLQLQVVGVMRGGLSCRR